MKAAEIIRLAREIVGTPYLHQARIGGLAVDCAGVPAYVGTKLGVDFNDFTQYGRQPVPAEMKKALDGALIRVPSVAQMQLADVVWIRFEEEPQHLGILGDHPRGGFTLIHAFNGMGFKKVVEHGLDEKWRKRIHGVWRYPGVEL